MVTIVKAVEWFALGDRVPYDHNSKQILDTGAVADSPEHRSHLQACWSFSDANRRGRRMTVERRREDDR